MLQRQIAGKFIPAIGLGCMNLIHAMRLNLDPALLDRARSLINQQNDSGPRYPAMVQQEIDTEEFAESESS